MALLERANARIDDHRDDDRDALEEVDILRADTDDEEARGNEADDERPSQRPAYGSLSSK